MKSLFLFSFLLPVSAQAWDSVAVMLQPQKSVVMIHEPVSGGRLDQFIKLLSKESSVLITSPDESIKIDCGLGTQTDSCVFRFLPSEQVQISKKTLNASLPIDSLQELSISFDNSNGDHFELMASSGELFFTGSKK